MKLIYYPDHDKRFSHIPKSERPLYPDEIHIGHHPLILVIKRDKPFSEVTGEDVRRYGADPCLIACDVPYTEGLHDG